jgi:hypothetical protein
MANIQIGTANGSTLGNPPSGDFYIFIDSNNSNSYTMRDSSGTDTILGTTGGYFKAEVLITSGSISGSASDQAVPGLTYTIPTAKDGNYIIYAMISVDIDNSDMKPLSIMIFKNGVKEANSVTMDFAKKNENQSVQLTYAMDGLVATDVVAIYVNNDNTNITSIITGRILAQKFE